ncbi:7,8-didemethyl-8-hydroxy-5-deazariboflavin synthase subunit CofG [Waterburya agarophytonicola K14]|uniref:7,8-didemethyl-8-hydroxy-5-deazariboflavin synthase n=1 Tax=Waterburya agarophytonicola KI4 TaxID=2874699 RepID=A0A964FI98_9CYAN|nr:7,8-didemethyl-8-hydroxy-5-deazariboflavin synthase subunit CofG [Waterburya agarophytonicola]MCC0179682.1 7,8-didemethyl-8-hydroxy-5-deazariboflavin synthase subunit CofG [Waterburya agarophytonicola KI4]
MNRSITYSPAHTIVPSYECFNRCSYCNFRVDVNKGSLISTEEAQEILQQLDSPSIAEILVLAGEIHPLSEDRKKWFTKIHEICDLSLSLGFLPHTNVGPLSWSEMKQLKKVNVSMGLMLEQVNPKFMETVHKNAPSKQPKLRLQQLEWAGKLKIPFTTGLLLGIGETKLDIEESFKAIALIQSRWGHIQEVILQPHSVGSNQEDSITTFDPNLLPSIIARARTILPENISIQIPPNLVSDPNFLLACLDAGATDLGGISPKDEVNPDYPHPTYASLLEVLEPAGWNLKPRLPIYSQYYCWLSPKLKKVVIAKEKTLIF